MKEEQSLIKRALEIWEINVNEDINLIDFVSMNEYKVANKEKPLLLTIGLQTCVALLAYAKNFSFLAHINMMYGNSYKSFEIVDNKEIKSCTKVKDLYEEIIKNKNNITSDINIGIVYGVSPLGKEYKTVEILEKDLNVLINLLNKENIVASRLPDMKIPSFILDSRNGSIIGENNEIVDISNYTIKNKRK